MGPNSTMESLKELGMKLKKNGIAIDIIDYGTENRSNTEILASLIESVDTEAYPSRLITIESNFGGFLLDALKSNAPELFNRSGSSGTSGGMDAGDGFDFDPEMDPELAMALKLSMEEEMNRQKSTAAPAVSSNDSENAMDTYEDANEGEIDGDKEDEELMMARAIALSMEQAKEQEGNQ